MEVLTRREAVQVARLSMSVKNGLWTLLYLYGLWA